MLTVSAVLEWSPAILEEVADRLVEQRRILADQLAELDDGAPPASWQATAAAKARPAHDRLRSVLEELTADVEQVAKAAASGAVAVRRARRPAQEAMSAAATHGFVVDPVTGLVTDPLTIGDPAEAADRAVVRDRIVDLLQQATHRAELADRELAGVLTAAVRFGYPWERARSIAWERGLRVHNGIDGLGAIARLVGTGLNRRDLKRSQRWLAHMLELQRRQWERQQRLRKWHLGQVTRWAGVAERRFNRWGTRWLKRFPRGMSQSFAERAEAMLVKPYTKEVAAARQRVATALHAYRTSAPRPLTGRLMSRLGSAGSALRLGGKALGVAGALYEGVQAGNAVQDRRWGDAAASAAAVAGGALLLATAPAAVVVGGVLVVGSLAYQYREEIGQVAQWVGDRASQARDAVADHVREAAEDPVGTAVSAGRTLLSAALPIG